jgi:hypothetical protein
VRALEAADYNEVVDWLPVGCIIPKPSSFIGRLDESRGSAVLALGLPAWLAREKC